MSSLNKAQVLGRLGQDPDVRYTQNNTAVANISIATSERYKDKQGEYQESTQWHRCVAWGRTAEICQEYLEKGSQVYVEGPLQTSEWEDKEGNPRKTTEIKILNLIMLGGKGQVSTSPGNSQSTDPAQSGGLEEGENFDKDDLPF